MKQHEDDLLTMTVSPACRHRVVYRHRDRPTAGDAVAAPVATRPVERRSTRYSDRPMDWRTRVFGMGSTASLFLAILACALVTWRAVQPVAPPPVLAVLAINPPAAPPETVEEVPDGPKQVEQKEQKPKERVDRPEPPRIVIPQLSPPLAPLPPPVEQVTATDPVPETTAPQSLPAPPANRATANTKATWESQLLAHLGKHRRYPGAARQAGQQGTVYVQFRMNRPGHVLSASIIQSSGFPTLDRAALDTLRRADPLPAIPDDKPDELDLTIPVEFFVRR